MKFPYRPYSVQPTPGHPDIVTVYRPSIPVRVVGPLGDASLLGLVDTGADATILPAFLIERLGIPVDRGVYSRFRGVGDQVVRVIYGALELEIGSDRRSYRWPATVGFLEGRHVAILGHTAFLEHFRATFDGARRALTLRANASLAP
jgi:hypothetical protein